MIRTMISLKSVLRISTAIAALAVSSLFSTPAQAFCRTYYCPVEDAAKETCNPNPEAPGCFGGANPADKVLYWPQRCIGFALQQDASVQVSYPVFERTAIDSLAAWQNAPCTGGTTPSIEFHSLGAVACANQEYNSDQGNANILVFRDKAWPHDNGQTVLALTTLTFNTEKGEIYDADMEINSADHNFTTTDDPALIDADLRSVMTHEAGHFLGMAHSPEADATMFASYEPKSIWMRDLSADDINGICSVYPADRAVDGCNPEPRHGFSSTCAVVATDPGGCCTTAPGRAGHEGAAACLALLGGFSLLASRRRSANPSKGRSA